jgi:hypothetical protein
MSRVTLGTSFEVDFSMNHLKATFIGVVRQDVNKSAGRSGFIGRNSLAPHAANCMQLLYDGRGGTTAFWRDCVTACSYSFSCWRAK